MGARGLQAIVLALALGAAVISGATAAPRHFSLGHVLPQKTAYSIAADIFAGKLAELSSNTLLIDQFPSGQLGQEEQMLQKIRTGDIDFIIVSTANSASVSPEAGVFSLHYLFRSEDHLRRALADPEVIAAARGMFDATVKGARVLSLGTQGFRDLYGRSEVHRVDDLKGVKIRVQATKTEDTLFPAYGAQTVHLPFGDVYTALQTGLVGMAENGINVYLAQKHYEAAPVLSLSEHEANNFVLWASDKVWESLSPQEQGWVQAAADEMARSQPEKALGLEKEALAKLRRIGVKVVADVDKSGFMTISQPIQDQIAAGLGEHAVKILELVRKVP